MIDALATFLTAAAMLGVLAQQGGPSSDLAAAVEQQLQAAGLHSHLERVLKQFTQQLQTAHTSLAVLHELQNESDKQPSKEKQAALALRQTVQQALILYTHINTLWPRPQRSTNGRHRSMPRPWSSRCKPVARSAGG
jgi:Flp pilus assembly protein TadB